MEAYTKQSKTKAFMWDINYSEEGKCASVYMGQF